LRSLDLEKIPEIRQRETSNNPKKSYRENQKSMMILEEQYINDK